jgi:hypothetical protein
VGGDPRRAGGRLDYDHYGAIRFKIWNPGGVSHDYDYDYDGVIRFKTQSPGGATTTFM